MKTKKTTSSDEISKKKIKSYRILTIDIEINHKVFEKTNQTKTI